MSNMNRASVNVGWMKMYVIQSKNGIMMNVEVNVKNDYMWNSSTCDCEYNKECEIYEFLDIQSFSCERCLIGKLLFKCEKWNIKSNWNVT